jgi:hypothetical protein
MNSTNFTSTNSDPGEACMAHIISQAPTSTGQLVTYLLCGKLGPTSYPMYRTLEGAAYEVGKHIHYADPEGNSTA